METKQFLTYNFERIDRTPFSSLYFNKDLKMAVCEADEEYIPIEHFKKLFESIHVLSDKFEITSFLFDKRRLRTFHQPSMEWYFSVWKPAMREKGLHRHYKILPNLDWFEKAVEAGRHEIYQKFGKDIVNGISIDYVKTVEEAIAQRLENPQRN